MPMLAVLRATCEVRSAMCFFPMPFRGRAFAPFLGAADMRRVGGRTFAPWVATAFWRFFCCRPRFFSTRSRRSLASRVNGSSLFPPCSLHLPSITRTSALSETRSLPWRRFHSSASSSNTSLLRLRFLMPFSFANCSHLVIGFTCGGSGLTRGNGVVPGGSWTYRPFTSDSLGSEKRSATRRWRTSRPRSRAASVADAPPEDGNAAGSRGDASHAVRLPRSSSRGPSKAPVASSAEAMRTRPASSSDIVREEGAREASLPGPEGRNREEGAAVKGSGRDAKCAGTTARGPERRRRRATKFFVATPPPPRGNRSPGVFRSFRARPGKSASFHVTSPRAGGSRSPSTRASTGGAT